MFFAGVRVSIDLHNPATVTATKHQDNAMDPGSHTNLPTHLTATFIDQAYEPSQTSKCIPRGDSDMSFGTVMRTLRWKGTTPPSLSRLHEATLSGI